MEQAGNKKNINQTSSFSIDHSVIWVTLILQNIILMKLYFFFSFKYGWRPHWKRVEKKRSYNKVFVHLWVWKLKFFGEFGCCENVWKCKCAWAREKKRRFPTYKNRLVKVLLNDFITSSFSIFFLPISKELGGFLLNF